AGASKEAPVSATRVASAPPRARDALSCSSCPDEPHALRQGFNSRKIICIRARTVPLRLREFRDVRQRLLKSCFQNESDCALAADSIAIDRITCGVRRLMPG